MAGKQLNTKILAVRIIPNADPMLLKNLDVRPGDKSLGIFTTDCDDVSYTAVDEATKKDRKSTRLNSSHARLSRMPSSA